MTIQSNLILILISLFIFKHFLIDFALQNKYQWANKGNFLHPGGILHSNLHLLGTFLVFGIFTNFDKEYFKFILFLSVIDFFIHYHIDLFKVKLSNDLYISNNSKAFWILFSVDQAFHLFTYVLLIYIFTNSSSLSGLIPIIPIVGLLFIFYQVFFIGELISAIYDKFLKIANGHN